jgi:tellurite resistance protein
MPRGPIVPASFFGIVLGLAGLGGCWRVAATVWNLPTWIGESLLAIAAGVWAILIILFIWKWMVARTDAIAEAQHPVACCYIGLIFVATLLIAIAAIPYSRTLALGLACAGWIGHILFSVWRTGALWKGNRAQGATTAVLYLPAVAGNFVSAAAAGNLGYADIATLFFGAGIFSWLAIESVLLQRLYNGEPLPAAIRPSLGIQLAPPVVGCVAYLSINGNVADTFALMLVGYGLLQAAILIRLLPWFAQNAFVAGYWGFSFGVSALPLAVLRMLQHGLQGPVATLALPLFGAANIVIAFLVVRTLILLATGRLLSAAPVSVPPQPLPK